MDPIWKQQKLAQYNKDIMHLTEINLYPEITNNDTIIIKLDAVDDDSNDYKETTGVHFMDEKTLILGDEDNNAILIFLPCDDEKVRTRSITKNMHVINKFCFDSNSVIHNKHEIVPMPNHLKSVIINYNTVINNFISRNISVDFLDNNYKQGGMHPLKDMKRHHEWIPEYRTHIKVERINMCKSCGNKAHKNCCASYDPKNRVRTTMVIGWHQ